MKKACVQQVDAFTDIKGKGNPAGVIVNGDIYTDIQMQEIAKNVGFNECVFICKSEKADVKLRYFTPGHETPLCGHATMAAIHILAQNVSADTMFMIETGAGILSVFYNHEAKEILMQHAKPKTIAFHGDVNQLCQSINIKAEDLDDRFPIIYGNTGSWTLLVPVKTEFALDVMIPQTKQFPEILKEVPRSSVHPFCIVNKKEYIFSARHFSSPYSNTIEDSVTGTASGVMGSYALDYIYRDENEMYMVVYQGKHVKKEGIVKVYAKRDECGHDIKIMGKAVYNKEIVVSISS